MKLPAPTISNVAFVGNYIPRKCGIATFTHDLCEAVAGADENIECIALPVSDGEPYKYPDRVRFEISRDDPAAYEQAASYLNLMDADLVSLQHEFGLFGGADGKYILRLLRDLRMPAVATLHTVLKEPTPSQLEVVRGLDAHCERFVVMAERGRQFLTQIYGVDREKIDLVPHGIHDVPFLDPNYFKHEFQVEGRLTILTFGLLSPNKGIETVIRALPDVLRTHPDVCYIVLGATHPNLVKEQGEAYRESLEQLTDSLGLGDSVKFHNRYVSLDELKKYIGAADIYVTPYLNEAQITSGTLAYAVGAGKPVISTPYWHAQELLADGRGSLVPFADPSALAKELVRLIEDETGRSVMRRKAYEVGREMVWEEVGKRYLASFRNAREGASPWPSASVRQTPGAPADHDRKLPEPCFNHLVNLTDSMGIWQHAHFSMPRYEDGYCTDDNARALILACMAAERSSASGSPLSPLAPRYLAFLDYAFDRNSGRFRNFLGADRVWLEEAGSEDSHGRALWALGHCVGSNALPHLRQLAGQLLVEGLPAAKRFTSPRAWAFTLLGASAYLTRFPGDIRAERTRKFLIAKLMGGLTAARERDWVWFEDSLSYANAKLPHALLVAGHAAGNANAVEAALESLEWLMRVQTGERGCFSPVGSERVYVRGGDRPHFDQQPIEAHASVSACVAAQRIGGDRKWYLEALRAFDWFMGRNDVGLPLYDPATGGCCDGLHFDRVNRNQGAESTLAFHLALAELQLAANGPQSKGFLHKRPDSVLKCAAA